MRLTPAHVKGARGMLSMSREDLAVAAGVSPLTIFKFEQEKVEPKEETLMRIQAALEERGIVFTNGNTPGVKYDESRIKPHLR